jgi:hypothetical protein
MFYMDSVKVYRFYRPSCGACNASQLEWTKFKSTVLFQRVKPIDVNLDVGLISANVDLSNNFGVNKVPTIWKVYPDGRRFEYKGDRTKDDLLLFALNDNSTL